VNADAQVVHLAASIEAAVSAGEGTVGSRIDSLMMELSETAAATRTTMAEAQAALARLTPEATAAIADYRALAQDARSAVVSADAQIVHLAASIEAAVSAVEATLDDARNVLGEDSPLRDEFSGTLQEITKAARSLRTLADDLDRHPEAVVVGKRPERRR